MTIPAIRVRAANAAPVRAERDVVLYWMTAFRRPAHNFSLDRAISIAEELRRPLIVFEPLRVGYRWASDRLHRFVLDGMADNRESFRKTPVRHYAYVEPEPGAAKGLLEALAASACAVITDDYPCFFHPAMVAAAARRLDVRLEAVDSNGLYPMRDTDRLFTHAHSFRRHLQKEILPHLGSFPSATPLRRCALPKAAVPARVLRRWPEAPAAMLRKGNRDALDVLPIDHEVAPVPYAGGTAAGRARLASFFRHRFSHYADARNHPDEDAASGISPWLHFGHVSSHEIWRRLVRHEEWLVEDVRSRPTGSREGFWNMSAPAESFVDELLTWRELGFNNCVLNPKYDRYESLPEWAQTTLREHAGDERPVTYTLNQLVDSQTCDDIWNAAQRQLRVEGRIHNYLRMLWGKKILEWTESPQQALEFMTELNDRYAVDGRDPNSYTGIHWVLGRYDRAWGPERPIFGKIRYMTSDSTRRKLRLKAYLKRHGPAETPRPAASV